jgi:hypothetical protein
MALCLPLASSSSSLAWLYAITGATRFNTLKCNDYKLSVHRTSGTEIDH